MSKPFFSISMPAYNGAKTIRLAVDSVIGQTFSDWSLVIVDDRSTDGTWELLCTEYASHPKIRLVRNERNLGLRGNLNCCLDLADGEWVGILAQDDAYRLHAFETIHAHLAPRDNVALWAHAQFTLYGARPPRAIVAYPGVTEFSAADLAALLYTRGNLFGVLSCYFLRLDFIRRAKLSYLDGELTVDMRLYLRLLLQYPETRAIYWPDLLTCVTSDETTTSHHLAQSGKAATDLIASMGDLAGLGWKKSTLLYQLARVLYCGAKYHRELQQQSAASLPLRMAGVILRELLRPARSPMGDTQV